MGEILEIPSAEIINYLSTNKEAVLVDVRTKEEWETIGKPNGEALGISTFFISYQIGKERVLNKNFDKEFSNLNISPSKTILFICRSGIRSLHAAAIVNRLGYETVNISGGFEGSAASGDAGWKENGLPCT